jgi:DNA repair photolyase
MSGPSAIKGRGAAENPANRFERLHLDADEFGDGRASGAPPPEAAPGSEADGAGPAAVRTEYFRDATRSIITRNDSPDVGFETSLNPYRGCEHGCIYCYARPTHEYLGLSAGLDFETKIFVKERAPELLREELVRRSWTPQTLVLSGVTDPYQPIERKLELTRGCLRVLTEFRNPVAIISKNVLVLRDADLLGELASHCAAAVAISITTLDERVRRVMEPRTATVEHRLQAIADLNARGIPAGVMVAPVVPGLTDHELPTILARAGEAGARFAGYVMLRLPYAVSPLFEAWLERHFPDRRQKVLDRIRDLRGGRLNDPRWGARMRGDGPFADLVSNVFRVARQRAGIPEGHPPLSAAAFRRVTNQGTLF